MNTETNEQQSEVVLPGQRLRLAREKLGFSQQQVADKLCLKLSVVKDIEQDTTHKQLAPAFVRGYIRSYARLLSIPEQEVLPTPQPSVTIMAPKISPAQSINLRSRRSKKQRDLLFKFLTLLIFLLVIGLTISWWWQNHKAAQQDLKNSVAQSHASNVSTDPKSVPLVLDNSEATSANSQSANTSSSERGDINSKATSAPPAASNTQLGQPQATQSQPETAAQPIAGMPSSAVTPSEQQAERQSNPLTQLVPSAHNAAPQTSTTPPAIETTGSELPVVSANSVNNDTHSSVADHGLHFTFANHCWLEVFDGSGKKLFSGLQKKGATLDLTGTLPYRIKLGAPASVTLTFDNKPVDLSRFALKNQVARFTLGTQ